MNLNIKLLKYTPAFVALLNGPFGICDYDRCKDILRDGVRNTISSGSSYNHKIASHKEFCNISKEYKLSEGNFHEFSREYAKKVSAQQSNAGGGASVGYGPFSFGGNYSQGRTENSLSEDEKVHLLNENRRQVMDYFRQNCGNETYEESLSQEATHMSLIADAGIVNAWKECMLNISGFVAYVTSRGDMADGSRSRDYALHMQFRSNHGAEITKYRLLYNREHVATSEKVRLKSRIPGVEKSQWEETADLRDKYGILRANSEVTLGVTHKDTSQNAVIIVNAELNTKLHNSVAVHLSKNIQPVAPAPAPGPAPEIVPNPIATTTTGAVFTRRLDVEALAPNLGEIWEDPHGLVWLDVVGGGRAHTLAEAKAVCRNLREILRRPVRLPSIEEYRDLVTWMGGTWGAPIAIGKDGVCIKHTVGSPFLPQILPHFDCGVLMSDSRFDGGILLGGELPLLCSECTDGQAYTVCFSPKLACAIRCVF